MKRPIEQNDVDAGIDQAVPLQALQAHFLPQDHLRNYEEQIEANNPHQQLCYCYFDSGCVHKLA